MKPTVLTGDKHLTASVWIITKKSPKKVLLIFHKKLNHWIQPGGHIERNENPVEAAIRETVEETGIDVSILLDKIADNSDGTKFLPPPDYFLEETIPAINDEPQHYHLDCMYVVEIDEIEPVLNRKESNKIGWFTKEDALMLDIHEDTRKILKEIL